MSPRKKDLLCQIFTLGSSSATRILRHNLGPFYGRHPPRQNTTIVQLGSPATPQTTLLVQRLHHGEPTTMNWRSGGCWPVAPPKATPKLASKSAGALKSDEAAVELKSVDIAIPWGRWAHDWSNTFVVLKKIVQQSTEVRSNCPE